MLRGTLLDRYGFHGREHDSLTGLRHHRAREFNGQFWMTEDPIGFAAGDTNLYRFVGNGPGNATDPSGLEEIFIQFNPTKIPEHVIASMIKDGKAIEHNGYVFILDRDPSGQGYHYFMIEKYTVETWHQPGPMHREATCLPKPWKTTDTDYRVVGYHRVRNVDQARVDQMLKDHKEFAKREIERHIQRAKSNSDDTINQIIYGLVLALPGLNIVDKIQHGGTLDMVIAVVEDGSVLIGVGGLVKGGKAGRAMVRIANAGNASTAAVQAGHGAAAIANGETTAGAIYLGDATLRLFGLTASQIALLRRGAPTSAAASAGSSAAKNINPGKLTFDPATKSWTSNGGLIYEQGSEQGNRVLHVLDHLSPNPLKSPRTLFNCERSNLIGLIDEAWAARQRAGVLQSNGNRVFDVAMGRVVGAGGETTIRIVVRDGTTKVITAYPIP